VLLHSWQSERLCYCLHLFLAVRQTEVSQLKKTLYCVYDEINSRIHTENGCYCCLRIIRFPICSIWNENFLIMLLFLSKSLDLAKKYYLHIEDPASWSSVFIIMPIAEFIPDQIPRFFIQPWWTQPCFYTYMHTTEDQWNLYAWTAWSLT
jgi:hypothetical protein